METFFEVINEYCGQIEDHTLSPIKKFTRTKLINIINETEIFLKSQCKQIDNINSKENKGLIVIEIEASRTIEYFIVLLTFASNMCLVRPKLTKSYSHEENHWLTWKGLKIHINYDQNLPKVLAGTLAINSSGTTGEPKEVCLRMDKFIISAKLFGDLLPETRLNVYNTFPCEYMASIFNMFMVPLVRGDDISLYPTFHISEIPRLTQAMKNKKPLQNLFYMSPAMSAILITFEKRNTSKKHDYNRANICISTGSILSKNQSMAFEELFDTHLMNCYGVTEAYGSISLNYKNKLPCLGNIRKDITIYYSNAGSSIIRLYLQSDLLFSGYIIDGKFERMETEIFDTCDFMQSPKVFPPNVQDRCITIDGQTLIKPDNPPLLCNEGVFIGRKSSFVKSGSEMISALYCTEFISSQLGYSSILINLSDLKIGTILALIVEGNSQSIGIQDIATKVRENIGAKYIPDIVFEIEELPRTSIGKIQEHNLIALAADAMINKSSELNIAWKSPRLS